MRGSETITGYGRRRGGTQGLCLGQDSDRGGPVGGGPQAGVPADRREAVTLDWADTAARKGPPRAVRRPQPPPQPLANPWTPVASTSARAAQCPAAPDPAHPSATATSTGAKSDPEDLCGPYRSRLLDPYRRHICTSSGVGFSHLETVGYHETSQSKRFFMAMGALVVFDAVDDNAGVNDMGSALPKNLRRRHRRSQPSAAPSHQRLDIQGLRMVAVLLVFATHLCGWPRGGFIGVDVFFVISGFLITGNLLRTAEKSGNVRFREFYWNRVRRIVPAATVVLILTYLATWLFFQPFRTQQVGIDALFAFLFMSNWWFAIRGTDYFATDDAVSPVQHYWSLSIEEQFYFVWPALIFVIGLYVGRRALTHSHRMRIVGAVMGGIVAASFGWALYETASSPTWAYFNTFARVWELGVGALLAIAVGGLARIPENVKPWLSWTGLGLIAASVVMITEDAVGFPAPWALLPVAGSAMVIAAGVAGEPRYQQFLRNPVSRYIGDISYSLYLVHWPIIVILAELMDRTTYYYATVIALTFGFAVLSYHLVETPLRRANWSNWGRGFSLRETTRNAALAGVSLVTVGLAVFALSPPALPPAVLAEAAKQASAGEVKPAKIEGAKELPLGPLGANLQKEIAVALKASEWSPLAPPIDEAIGGLTAPTDVIACGDADFYDQNCVWGSPSALFRIVVVGDSIAVAYGGPLRQLAEDSGGRIQIHSVAFSGCQFSADDIFNADPANVAACPGVKEHALEVINTTKPDVVLISDSYWQKKLVGSQQNLTSVEWANGMQKIVDRFRANTGKVVWLSPPPADQNIATCYGKRGSTPADCISKVTAQWLDMSKAEQDVAKAVGGVWIDSRPWFCSDGECPPFVESTLTKRDTAHPTKAYGEKIYPVIAESLRTAGVLGPTG